MKAGLWALFGVSGTQPQTVMNADCERDQWGTKDKQREAAVISGTEVKGLPLDEWW